MRTLLVTTILIFLSKPAMAENLKVAFPSNLPPWTIQESNSGITVDILRKSLKLKGHTLEAVYRSLKELNQSIGEDADANAQVESKKVKGHYSEEILNFETSLISLEPGGLRIKSIDDLKKLKIHAFQNASLLFGKSFEAMAKKNPGYSEIVNQELQVVHLYNGDTDCILIDRHIFLYFRRITPLTNTSMPVHFHQIRGLTEKSPAFVVFKNPALRDDFNEGLRKIKKSGEFENIYYKYTP